MARTTDTEVLELVTTDKDVGWAVETATEIVDEHLVGIGLSEALLRRIEMFIAAHLAELALGTAGLTRSSTGMASESYANIFGQGFRATRWGQQALALDHTGTLLNATTVLLKAELKII